MPPILRRWLPLALILAGAVAGLVAFGDSLSLDALRDNRAALLAWRDGHPVAAPVLFVALYAAIVAFSVPGAIWVTLTGGFVFGLFPGVLYNVTGATLGAVALFSAVRAGLGERWRTRLAEGKAQSLAAAIRDNEVPVLLTMRLVPVVPFFLANLIPAFLGVALMRFAWTTLVGILPGALVYTWVGAGLGEVFATGGSPDLGLIFRPAVLAPLIALAALSFLPVLLKRRQGGRT